MIRGANGEEILEDGEHLRLPISMMDSLQRAVAAATPPSVRREYGVARLTDAEIAARQAVYAARDKRLSDAWKSPPTLASAPASAPKAATKRLTVEDARAAYERRLQNAWKEGAR